jgi:predicted nucleotidyltransferase
VARTTAQAFNHFYDNELYPTNAQKIDVSHKREKTEEYLRAAFPSSSTLPLKRVVLIGSADRSTHIQPVSDVDVLAEFTNKDEIFETYRYASSDFLQRVRRGLDAQTSIKQIGARGQAVRLFYTKGAHVDIAPVFHWSGGGYALPAGDNGWTTTDPEAQATWFASRRTIVGANLNRVVRFAKHWNRTHSSYFQSYHLEVLVASMFSSVGSNTRGALQIFFDSGMNWLSVSDPAGHSGDLSSYLSYNTRIALRSRFSNAYARAVDAIAAEDEGDHAEAKRLWRIELGDSFSTA